MGNLFFCIILAQPWEEAACCGVECDVMVADVAPEQEHAHWDQPRKVVETEEGNFVKTIAAPGPLDAAPFDDEALRGLSEEELARIMGVLQLGGGPGDSLANLSSASVRRILLEDELSASRDVPRVATWRLAAIGLTIAMLLVGALIFLLFTANDPCERRCASCHRRLLALEALDGEGANDGGAELMALRRERDSLAARVLALERSAAESDATALPERHAAMQEEIEKLRKLSQHCETGAWGADLLQKLGERGEGVQIGQQLRVAQLGGSAALFPGPSSGAASGVPPAVERSAPLGDVVDATSAVGTAEL